MLLLAVFLVVFAMYQLWDIAANKKGLEASAIGSAFVGAPHTAPSGANPLSTQNSNPASGQSSNQNPNSDPGNSDVKDLQVTAPTANTIPPLPPKKLTYGNMSLQAKSAIVVDTTSGKVLYKKNANESLPLASITKVMAAAAATDLLKPDDTVTMTPDALATDGDYGFSLGERWTFENLLNYSLVISANDGMVAIADAAAKKYNQSGILVKTMNDKAQQLGFSQMHFYNPSGLDVDQTKSGGYGSAADVAALFQYVLLKYPHLLDATTQKTIDSTDESGRAFHGTNTDEIIAKIPGVRASKTGYTDLAGGNLAVTWNAGLDHAITIVVLGSTFSGRFSDMEQLVKATINELGEGSEVSFGNTN